MTLHLLLYQHQMKMGPKRKYFSPGSSWHRKYTVKEENLFSLTAPPKVFICQCRQLGRWCLSIQHPLIITCILP